MRFTHAVGCWLELTEWIHENKEVHGKSIDFWNANTINEVLLIILNLYRITLFISVAVHYKMSKFASSLSVT
jgi:hypothetical protein